MNAKNWVIVGVVCLVVIALWAWSPRETLAPVPMDGAGTSTVPATGERQVLVYFLNNKLDPEIACDKVFPASRKVMDTPAIARAVLDELIKGPTADEKAAGYITEVSPEAKVRSIVINNGDLNVDFSSELANPGGSCRALAIRAQITETLKQLSGVTNVIITVNGRLDALEP